MAGDTMKHTEVSATVLPGVIYRGIDVPSEPTGRLITVAKDIAKLHLDIVQAYLDAPRVQPDDEVTKYATAGGEF